MNNVTLIGNLTRDPELMTTNSGVSVCKMTIAVNRTYKDDKGKDVDFFNIIAWRGLGENCNKYTRKGKKIAVRGRIMTKEWDRDDGSKAYGFDIVADEVIFLSPAAAGKGEDDLPAPPPERKTTNKETAKEKFEKLEDVTNEDLPF